MTYLITDSEGSRLDAVAARCAQVLSTLHGDQLTAALADDVKRRVMSDEQLRAHALANVHPDDLALALGLAQ